jgi:hypothetical protein
MTLGLTSSTALKASKSTVVSFSHIMPHRASYLENDSLFCYSANGESEKVMGQAIKKYGWKRNDLVISTKVFTSSSS